MVASVTDRYCNAARRFCFGLQCLSNLSDKLLMLCSPRVPGLAGALMYLELQRNFCIRSEMVLRMPQIYDYLEYRKVGLRHTSTGLCVRCSGRGLSGPLGLDKNGDN